MKTTIEWLRTLPKDIRDKAIANIRDWFAWEAMKASVAAWEPHDVCAVRFLSSRAYKMADAMLAARKESK